MATLTRLFIHPVKSMRGIGLTHALADVSGLAFDRIFMITELTVRLLPLASFPRWYGLLLHLCMMACISPHQMAVAHMFVLLISPHKTHQPKFGAHILPRELHQTRSTNG
ncbi:putative 2Fe-2S iron-sulfur cluster binding protein [Escherichia coli]|uniref:Putative 2Fe-2S iron-sulfur cluster binding protein n=1 Tax=Escherichia coli TaxID=562 RepID=A0A376MW41_ECOLX|nr:putative 2Fe-2S iron-sulfur cluster binding protein [Escherichia coli]